MRVSTRWLLTPPTLVVGGTLLSLLLVGGMPSREVPAPRCPMGSERIAIAALDLDPAAEISERAGRTPYFHLFESGSAEAEIVGNDFSAVETGAGARVGYLLSELDVDCLVAGEAGSRLRAVLAAEGIGFCPGRGPVAERALDLLGLEEAPS